jgi:hypothetical protein
MTLKFLKLAFTQEKVMIWLTESPLVTVPALIPVSVPALVEQIFAAGRLSRHEHMQLTSVMLSNSQLPEVERSQISQILDYVQIGRLKLVD